MPPVNAMPSWKAPTDEEYKKMLSEELSVIFQKILRSHMKRGDELNEKLLARKINKVVIFAKKMAISEYQQERKLDLHAIR